MPAGPERPKGTSTGFSTTRHGCVLPYHRITRVSPYHRITVSPRARITSPTEGGAAAAQGLAARLPAAPREGLRLRITTAAPPSARSRARPAALSDLSKLLLLSLPGCSSALSKFGHMSSLLDQPLVEVTAA
jgi:hypothetical protein